MAPHCGSHRALCSCLPKKGIPSAVVWTVRRWCQDYTAGLEESSTGEAPRLQKFCRHLTTECSRHHASRNVSWPQRAPSAVGHETAVVGQVERGACPDSYWRTIGMLWTVPRAQYDVFCVSKGSHSWLTYTRTEISKRDWRDRFAGTTFNKTRLLVIAASPYRVPKKVGANGDFCHFRPAQQHTCGCVWLSISVQ